MPAVTFSAAGNKLTAMRWRVARGAVVAGIGLIGLTHFAQSLRAEMAAPDRDESLRLRDQIVALAPTVRRDEAERAASCAYNTAEQLRRDYRVVGPPLFHNFLVNTGIRKRGLCFQWAEDLLARLDALHLSTLELHWGEARASTWREHNCVVVTAKGQPFGRGIILDCWRHSGHLFWAKLGEDHYPWIEDSAYAQLTRARAAPPLEMPRAAKRQIELTARTRSAVSSL